MTAVLKTPAGSSGAGAGWTPGRRRTSWPTARKQATSVLMAPTPACDPTTARAKAEAQGYGRGAALAAGAGRGVVGGTASAGGAGRLVSARFDGSRCKRSRMSSTAAGGTRRRRT